ncbi:MAG: PKD domain-containing protein [Thaumarchaeota archaeon]|nr:PKD domain-containing protein [Nitrososphaerota archaeon]
MTPAHANCPATGCVQGGDTLNVVVTPATGGSPLAVSYKASFTGSSVMKSVVWSFGDGNSVSGVMNGTHTYQSAGNYTGTVDVDAKDGTSYTQQFSVSVTGGIGANVLNATIANPDNGTMNAYKFLLQEHNGSTVASSLPPLSVQTNSPSYGQGDTIVINGVVKNTSNQTAVTVRIINSLKNMVSIAQFIPHSDGSFSTKVLATGPLWTKAGTYTIIAQYGPATNATTSFSYSGGDGTSTIKVSTNGTYSLQTSAGTFNIPYTIQGGTIQSMQILGQQKTLAITLSTTANGSLSVSLPRALIDAKEAPPTPTGPNSTSTQQFNPAEMPDQSFIVQDGGQNVQFTEVKNTNTRTLGIPFHKGDTTIDIVGTVSVPEFGPIAALVLAIAIISIIAVSAKTGLRFMPKY